MLNVLNITNTVLLRTKTTGSAVTEITSSGVDVSAYAGFGILQLVTTAGGGTQQKITASLQESSDNANWTTVSDYLIDTGSFNINGDAKVYAFDTDNIKNFIRIVAATSGSCGLGANLLAWRKYC